MNEYLAGYLSGYMTKVAGDKDKPENPWYHSIVDHYKANKRAYDLAGAGLVSGGIGAAVAGKGNRLAGFGIGAPVGMAGKVLYDNYAPKESIEGAIKRYFEGKKEEDNDSVRTSDGSDYKQTYPEVWSEFGNSMAKVLNPRRPLVAIRNLLQELYPD